MRLAVCSWSLQPTDPEDLVQKVRACGLDRVQLANCTRSRPQALTFCTKSSGSVGCKLHEQTANRMGEPPRTG